MPDLKHFDTELGADPSRDVLRPFTITAEPRGGAHGVMTRAERIAKAVLAPTNEACRAHLSLVYHDFFGRHWQKHARLSRSLQAGARAPWRAQ